MKLSEVLQAVRLIKQGNHGAQFHKYHPALKDITPGAMSHQSPYGHHQLLLNPHYDHRGSIPGLASVSHGIRLGGTGTSASGAYGGQPAHSYHSTGYGGHMGGTSGGHPAPAGYDYHPAQQPHTPIADTSGAVYSTGKSKSTGSSTITALTLLSFLFFLNILQSCLKEHMDTMNPTVMVMTAGVSRSRVSKLAEMNSREQQNSISINLPQPIQTMTRGDSVADASTNPKDQSPFNGGGGVGGGSSGSKIEYTNRPDPDPEYYHPYANRTTTQADNYYDDQYHYPYRHYQRLTGSFSSQPPSSSPASSFSSASHSPNSNNYYSDTMDPYFMRIN